MSPPAAWNVPAAIASASRLVSAIRRCQTASNSSSAPPPATK